MSKYISPWHLLLLCSIFALMHWRYLHGDSQRRRPTTGCRTEATNWCCSCPIDTACHCFISSLVCLLACNGRRCCQPLRDINYSTDCDKSLQTRLMLPPKLLDKACQKLRGIPDIPPQRITDLETAIRQLRQLSCILDSCTISASYEVSQAQKALLLMPRTAKGASTSSDELNAQVSLPSDDEYHAFQDQDQLQEHQSIAQG